MKKLILSENNRAKMFDLLALKYRIVKKKRPHSHSERVFVYQFCTALFVVWHSSRKGEKYLIYKFVDILKLPIWCYCSKSYENPTSECECLLYALHGTHYDATGSVYSTVKSVYSLRISLVSVSDGICECIHTLCVLRFDTSDERDERTICVVVMLSELNCTELVTSTQL